MYSTERNLQMTFISEQGKLNSMQLAIGFSLILKQFPNKMKKKIKNANPEAVLCFQNLKQS